MIGPEPFCGLGKGTLSTLMNGEEEKEKELAVPFNSRITRCSLFVTCMYNNEYLVAAIFSSRRSCVALNKFYYAETSMDFKNNSAVVSITGNELNPQSHSTTDHTNSVSFKEGFLEHGSDVMDEEICTRFRWKRNGKLVEQEQVIETLKVQLKNTRRELGA
ncbi:uncharacterized protein LOC119675255 [Teleopsis dalmanni]|uniref:uncharacterized protein LOC119675255 n=1 Tax=Teleopsis dalmanni TaxID=139649 RepID=UPI0018CDA452|nr:uncharacterized protein LOC119675255 [Teleopsis dalmanni]